MMKCFTLKNNEVQTLPLRKNRAPAHSNSLNRAQNILLNRAQNISLIASGIFSALIIASPLQANELDLRVSDDTLHGNFTISEEDSKTSLAVGYFYKDDDHSANIINADLHAKGQTAIGNLPATVSIGVQGDVFKQGDFKGTAFGVGGSVRINIPSTPGLSIESALHYAPNVLSFGDSDEFRRFRLQTNYRLIENADVSFGYQYLNVGVDGGSNHTFESGVFLGLKMKF